MIIFSPIAYEQKYRELSLRTIETFNQYCKNSKLNIVTDDVDFYTKHLSNHIQVVKGLDTGKEFKANLKYLCLKESIKLADIGDFIVIMDADCFFTDKFDDSIFDTFNTGLTVQLGKDRYLAEELQSGVIVNKILSLNPDTTQKYHIFREACPIFKVNSNTIDFINAWEDICNKIDELQITHAAETFDIQIAALRSDYQINNLGNSSIIEMILMTDDHGGIGSPLS